MLERIRPQDAGWDDVPFLLALLVEEVQEMRHTQMRAGDAESAAKFANRVERAVLRGARRGARF